MKGSPMKLGTIQGTAGHTSALKMKMEKDAAAKMKKEAAMKMKEEAAMKMKKESAMKMKKESPMDFNAELKKASADGKLSGKFKEAVDAAPTKMKKEAPMKEKPLQSYSTAYSKMKDAEGGGKKDQYGRVYKDEAEFTKAAKAYNEKKYGTTEPSKDSKKAGQTRKELAGAHTKTTTKKVKTVKRDDKDVVVKKGIGAKKGKTLTAQQKSKERLKIDQANKAIKDAKKAKDKDARDKAQLEKAEIKAGRDDAKTGTMLSRAIARRKVKRNKRQLERRAKKNEDKA